MNNISYLTRKISICIAHKLYNEKLSPQENMEIYQKCTNIHGHNLDVFITIKDKIDPETGMVINFKTLKSILKTNIYDKVDHKYLNQDIKEFKEILPTVENIAVVFWSWLQKDLPNLYEIKIQETENNYTIYRGE
jgi:6-pyruvoyltetrahydropterin/6-carboxytetrahydropterin synthase